MRPHINNRVCQQHATPCQILALVSTGASTRSCVASVATDETWGTTNYMAYETYLCQATTQICNMTVCSIVTQHCNHSLQQSF